VAPEAGSQEIVKTTGIGRSDDPALGGQVTEFVGFEFGYKSASPLA
jgi:hypothetical protein